MDVELNEIYAGQVVDIQFTISTESKVIIDLSTATDMRIDFHRMNGARKTGVASLVGAGTAGTLKYTTLATDLDIPGIWSAQAFYTLAGVEYPAASVTFRVKPKG